MPHLNDPGIDFTVEVFIVHDGRVLLRRHDKYDMWLSVGGHIEPGEDPVEAAHREVMEEVGLQIQLLGEPPIADGSFGELQRPYALGRHRISDTHEHVTLVYLATSDSDAIAPQGIDEPDASCRWWTREEIESSGDLVADVHRYALAALAAASRD